MPRERGPKAGAPQEKVNARQTKMVLVRLWKYLSGQIWLLLAALAMTVVSNLLSLVGPSLSGQAIDAIGSKAGGVNFQRVFYYCGLMLIFYVVSSVLSYLLSILMVTLSQRVIFSMRKDLFDRLTRLPVSFFDKNQAGEIVSRMSYDIDTVNASLSTDLIQILTSVITVVGSFIMMVRLSPPLVLIFLVTIPVSIFFTRYMATKVRPLFRKRSAALGELNGYVEEIISGQKTIKAYHQEDTMIERFDQRNKEAVDAYYTADYYGTMTGPTVNFINNLSLSLISVFGALLFLYGKLSLGNVASFVLYSRRFSGPINEVANIISELQSAVAAAERVFRLMDELPEPPDELNALPLKEVVGRVSLEHVKFGYTPDREILHDLSLEVEKGQLIAVVGPTGAGKTTLINLLMRFYDLNGGRILIDGQDIKNVTRDSLRGAFSMVLQDTWLFNGTIQENIAYARPESTKEEVIEAAKAAHIHRYIESLPQGYDTVLSDDGVNISKGQKQLMTIARAMLMDSTMLILDEATSNVDTRTEQQVQDACRKLMAGKTCFVIAHRLSTIRHADCILVVREGDIVEQGKHEALLSKGGFYADLYNAQFK